MELRALQLQPSSSWKSALDKSNRYSVEEQLCQNALSLQSEDVFELFPPVRHSMGAEILEICIEARAKFTFIGLISFPKLKCLHSAESTRTSFRFCLPVLSTCVCVSVSICVLIEFTYLFR